VLALLSKESALLLPAVLLLVPGGVRPIKARVTAAAAVGVGAFAALALRFYANAVVTALGGDAYVVALSPVRWVRNLSNYFARAVPPAILLVIAAMTTRGGRLPAINDRDGKATRAIALGLCWFVAFIAPALLLTLRSEVRLYLPAFGVALAGAAIIEKMLTARTRVVAALAIAVVLLGGYQAVRSHEARRDARFSQAFVAALRGSSFLQAHRGPIEIVAADAETDRLLRDTLGGYTNFVVHRTLGWPGDAANTFDHAPPAGSLKVRCAVDGDGVVLSAM
jgi:hypothetical protein